MTTGAPHDPITTCTDPVILNQWHPIGPCAEATPDLVAETTLLDEPVNYAITHTGHPTAWRSRGSTPAGSSALRAWQSFR